MTEKWLVGSSIQNTLRWIRGRGQSVYSVSGLVLKYATQPLWYSVDLFIVFQEPVLAVNLIVM